MLFTLSACAFALALAVFVYFFDRYMGASDTGEIADSMSQIRDQTGRKDPAKRSRAATGN